MTATVVEHNNEIIIEGSIRFDDVLLVRQACERYLQQAERDLIFNLSKVQNCDSSAVSLLLVLLRLAQLQNKSIVFTHLPVPLLNVMQLCGVRKIIPTR